MLNILCVCGNGMGTSTIVKLTVQSICDSYGIDCHIESCAFGEAMAYIMNTDLIVTSPEWSQMLPDHDAILVETVNLIDRAAVEAELIPVIREHFPNAITKE